MTDASQQIFEQLTVIRSGARAVHEQRDACTDLLWDGGNELGHAAGHAILESFEWSLAGRGDQQLSGMELRIHVGQHASCVSGVEAEKKQIAIGGKLARAGDVDAGKLGGQRCQLALRAIRRPNTFDCERMAARQRPNQHASHAANANEAGVHS